jgi:hypothetical protein
VTVATERDNKALNDLEIAAESNSVARCRQVDKIPVKC